jgi:hypothetical protein
MTSARRAVGAAAVLLVLPVVAAAHGRSLSYSRWTLGERGATVELRLARIELNAAGLPSRGPRLAAYATERLRLLRGGRPCVAGPVEMRDVPGGWVALSWANVCQGGGPLAMETKLLVEPYPQHLNFARVVAADGRVVERVLQAADGQVTIADTMAAPRAEGAGATLRRFVALGVEHIATGWDHLAFVVGLVLLATTVGEVVSLATGFTVAHSVTLALAVTGVLRPETHAVDAVIGLSIALIAAENAWLLGGRPRVVPVATAASLLGLALAAAVARSPVDPGVLVGMALFAWCHFLLLARAARPARLRVAVAFAFGLVHGFGFAGILTEMALAPGRMALALGGFNVGVEIGQLAVILVAWPVVRLAVRLGIGGAFVEAGSAVLAGFGVFWLVVRTFAR